MIRNLLLRRILHLIYKEIQPKKVITRYQNLISKTKIYCWEFIDQNWKVVTQNQNLIKKVITQNQNLIKVKKFP